MESSERTKRRKVKWERIMKIYSPIYCLLFIIFIVLLPVTLKKDNCDKGHEWAAHYTMCSFIGIFSLLNLSLYAVCPRTIKLTKRNILEAVFLLIGEICGQLDLYTDFCFLNIVWHIEDNETARLLGWAALILICLTTIPHFLYLIYYILKVIFGRIEKKHILLLSTYTEKHFIHFAVLETKKNKINIADRVMTSRLAMWKLVTEDVPQCCIQMLYMFKELCVVRSQGGWFLWVSISLSLICVAVVSLPSFIIAYYQRRRPTMISQLLKEQVVDMRLYLPLDKDIHNLFIDLGDNSQVRVKLLKMSIYIIILYIYIYIEFCNLKGPMLEGITSMLHRNQTITGLNISIHHNAKYIHIGNNVIGDEGSKYISNGIKANYTLTDLDLRHNDIHDIGLKEMFITIQFKRSFKYLYLSHNIMGQESTDALEQCIQYPFQLQILKLSNIYIYIYKLGNTQLSEDQTYQILNSIKNRYRKEEGHKLNRVEKEEEENAKQNEEEKEEQNEELKLKLSELDLCKVHFLSLYIYLLFSL